MSIFERAVEKLGGNTEQGHAQAGKPAAPPPGARALPGYGPGDRGQWGSRAKRVQADAETLQASGLLVPDRWSAEIATQFRRIKRPLINNISAKGRLAVTDARCILVTSALPGEGKSFVACNLALSIAQERDLTCVLIDGDLLSPTLTQGLGLTQGEGLVNIVESETTDLAEAIYATGIPKLSFIPTGPRHEQAHELLTSARMLRLKRELLDRYDDRVLVIDGPPLLATAEAHALTEMAGQVVLVVSGGDTSKSAVKEAVASLDRSKPVGVVFNKQRYAGEHGNYGGAYPYGQKADGKRG